MKVATVAAIVRATGTGLGAAICSDHSSLYKLLSPREILARVMNGTHRTYALIGLISFISRPISPMSPILTEPNGDSKFGLRGCQEWLPADAALRSRRSSW